MKKATKQLTTITRGYATRLVKQKKATLEGATTVNKVRYQIVKMTDGSLKYYELKPGQLAGLTPKIGPPELSRGHKTEIVSFRVPKPLAAELREKWDADRKRAIAKLNRPKRK